MNCSTSSLTFFSSPREFPVYSLNVPALVRDRHVLGLSPSESSVIHQEERWFHYDEFSIFRTKAKET